MKVKILTFFTILGLVWAAGLSAESQTWRTKGFGRAKPDINIEKTGSTGKNSFLGSLRVSTSVGGEMEFFLSDRFSLALGAELKKKSPTGFMVNDVGTSFMTQGFQFQFDATLVPILGTLKFNIPFNKFRAYLGAGMGLYIGKVNMNWTSDGAGGIGNDRIRAKGTAIIPHLNWGLDYQFTRNMAVGLDMRYVMGSLDSYTIRECANEALIGQQLSFINGSGVQKPFPWDLKGLSVGFIVKLNF